MKKLFRNLLVLLLLIAAGVAALPFVLNDDEDYEARLVGAILFVEGALEEGASGSHYRLYEPGLSALSGENSWKLDAKIRSTDEFNQEKFGNLSATLSTLCRPYSMAACWRLDELMIDGELAQLETAENLEPVAEPAGDETAAKSETAAGDLATDDDSKVPESLDELEGNGEAPAQEAGAQETGGQEAEGQEAEGTQSAENSGPQETPQETAEPAPAAEDSASGGDTQQASVPQVQSASTSQSESQTTEAGLPASEFSKDVIALVQRQLDRLGYVPGPVDGVIGPRTEKAIKAYQEDHELPSNGRINEALLKALQIPQTANSN